MFCISCGIKRKEIRQITVGFLWRRLVHGLPQCLEEDCKTAGCKLIYRCQARLFDRVSPKIYKFLKISIVWRVETVTPLHLLYFKVSGIIWKSPYYGKLQIMKSIGGISIMLTAFLNRCDLLTAVLFSHRKLKMAL